jgi:glycosyltransferase involved in cell wall biosynthesis
MKLSLSVLVPCYNVAPTVEAVVRDIYRVTDKIADPLEIICIDDGSSDSTNRILRRLTADIPHLSVINHDKNAGYGVTIKELYQTGKYTWLFTFPGDGQYDAKELTKLTPNIENADMILGWRVDRNDPPIRLFQSNVYNALLNLLFNINLHDVNTIRLMKRSIIKQISLHSTSAFVDAELAIHAKHEKFRIIEVPVEHKKRLKKGATGGNILRTILPTIADIIKFIFS